MRCDFCGELNPLVEPPEGKMARCRRCRRPLPASGSGSSEGGDRELTEALCEALWTVAKGGEPGRGEVTELVVRGLIARASRPQGYELTAMGMEALRQPPEE